jgi:lipocalin-like protein
MNMNKAKKALLLTVATLSAVYPSISSAQSKNGLVGTWKLLSASYVMDNGQINQEPYGPHPTGFITYTTDDRFMVTIAFDGRKTLSVNDPITAPVEERAQAFATFGAYAGRYTFTRDKVIHHVEVAWIQNWVGTDQVRLVTLKGDRLSLRTLSSPIGGVSHTAELVFERTK